MAKIAVIGGAGFIGTNLVKELVASEKEVVVIDDFSLGDRGNLSGLDIEIIQTSILEPENYEIALSQCDFVVHLAARGSVPRSISDPEGSFQVNAIGTLKVLQTIRRLQIPLIYSSSSSVYGKNTDLPKSEFTWTSPISPYAASKLAAESLVSSYAESYGMDCSVLRFFNVFGPYQRPNHDYAAVIPKWIWNAMNGKELVIEGDGRQTRDFTYVRDVVLVIKTIIERGKGTSLVNVAFGVSISLLEVIEILKKFFPEIEIVKKPARIGDVKHSLNDSKQFQALFPNIYRTDFVTALDSTIAWMRDNKTKFSSLPNIGV